MEIDYGPFQRQITLAEDIDPENASATYERGILTVRLPIAPQPTPRESVLIAVRRAT
jgi:HSP20 family molecular chaperone IbpA